jgi:hypothetical protein
LEAVTDLMRHTHTTDETDQTAKKRHSPHGSDQVLIRYAINDVNLIRRTMRV